MKRIASILLGYTLVLISLPAQSISWHPYAVMGLGVLQTSQTQNLTLQTSPSPGLVNQYQSNSTAKYTKLVGLGAQKTAMMLKADTSLLVGMEALFLNNQEASGLVRPMINVGPNFDVLNFSYNLNSFLFLAKTTLSKAALIKEWGGYLDLGVGGSLNHLSSYSEVAPVGSTAIPMASPFADRSQAQFAFSIGAGLTHLVASRSEISLGYRYIYTGTGRFGSSPSQSGSQRLSFNNLGHHFLTLAARI